MKHLKYKNFLIASGISFIFNALLVNVDVQIIPDPRALYVRTAMTLISLTGIVLYPLIRKSNRRYNIAVFLFTVSLSFLVGFLDVMSFKAQNNYYNGIIQYMIMAMILSPDQKYYYATLVFSISPYIILINYLFPGLKQTFPITTGMIIFGFLYAVMIHMVANLQNSILNKSEEKSSILESISEAFFSINKSKQLIYINENATRLANKMGITSLPLYSATIDQLFPAMVSSGLYDNVIDCINNGNSYTYNQYFPEFNKSFSIRINSHASVTSVYLLDITEIENDKKYIGTQLENKINSIRRMVHDVKSPLQGIDFNAHFIRKLNLEFKSDKLEKYTGRIEESSKLINSMTNLLMEPVIESMEYTGIKKIFYQLFDTIQNNQVSFVYNEIPPVNVYGCSASVYKALGNVVNNAIKYNTDNLIQFRVETQSDRLLVKVTNHSSLTEIDDQVFSEFHRMTNVRDAEGTGLGLAITRDIMDQLKGKIDYKLVENEITFTLDFKIVELLAA